jgi:hypothetical protein
MSVESLAELSRLGFRHVATFRETAGELELEAIAGPTEYKAAMRRRDALYAFVASSVLYIGRTTQEPRRRLHGYCRPSDSQSTNLRCHAAIRSLLARGMPVHVHLFAPPLELQYAGYGINLAVGLEDSLIRAFAPPWNGVRSGALLSEDAEREVEVEGASPEAVSLGSMDQENEPDEAAAGDAGVPEAHAGCDEAGFDKELAPYHVRTGLLNYPAGFAAPLGEHGEPLEIYLDGVDQPIRTQINRNAYGGAGLRGIRLGPDRILRGWLQERFQVGQRVRATVISPNVITLRRA